MEQRNPYSTRWVQSILKSMFIYGLGAIIRVLYNHQDTDYE